MYFDMQTDGEGWVGSRHTDRRHHPREGGARDGWVQRSLTTSTLLQATANALPRMGMQPGLPSHPGPSAKREGRRSVDGRRRPPRAPMDSGTGNYLELRVWHAVLDMLLQAGRSSTRLATEPMQRDLAVSREKKRRVMRGQTEPDLR